MQCETLPVLSCRRLPQYSRAGMKTIIITSPEDLGRALPARRKELQLTIAEVADMVGCSPRFISEVERGKASASIGLILQIGRELRRAAAATL